MRFCVLGPVLVADASGEWQRLRSDRQRALLAMLLFEANQPVSIERLVDALWLGTPPTSYVSNLQTYVSRLRERIGFARIDHSGRGYRLLVDEADVDLLVFRAESDRGRRAARAGDVLAAVRHLRSALAQWRDRPLADLQLPVLEPEVIQLETERLAVYEDCVDAELAAGRHSALIGELRAEAAAHPLSERLAGQLMVALQRSGRQAEALEVYRDTRARLVEEAGVEPGPELRRVHARVLRGELVGPDVRPICQLPQDIADFCGRGETVEELTAMVRREPLVVLSGEPGVGKSTLAVRVAHQLRHAFPDGQLFAHLAGATSPRDPADILAEWLVALTGNEAVVTSDVQARAAMFRSQLADRRMLVVLDDAADPAQVRPLLPGTSSCAAIVTGRRRLSGLAGAHGIHVKPFTDAEAGTLLERIAGNRVAAEPANAARIAAACGNLPLALRIAGSRLALRPQLRVSAFADRLEDELRRLDELAVNDLQVRSSLALSYHSLTASARAVFQLIGIVDIPNLSALAIGVLRGEPDSDGAVEELVEASLLQPVGDHDSGEPRYQMHDLVRAFARELALAKDGLAERELASNRLVDTAFALADLAAHRLPRAMPVPEFTGTAPAPGIAASIVNRVLADPEAWFAANGSPSWRVLACCAGLAGIARPCWSLSASAVTSGCTAITQTFGRAP